MRLQSRLSVAIVAIRETASLFYRAITFRNRYNKSFNLRKIQI